MLSGFRKTALRSPGVARCARLDPSPVEQKGTPPGAHSHALKKSQPIPQPPVRVVGGHTIPLHLSAGRLVLEFGMLFSGLPLTRTCERVYAKAKDLGLLKGTSELVTAIIVVEFTGRVTGTDLVIPDYISSRIVVPFAAAFRTAYGELWLHRKLLVEDLLDVAIDLSRLLKPADKTGKSLNHRLIFADKHGNCKQPWMEKRLYGQGEMQKESSRLRFVRAAE